jgi:signal transduction histidine kinase
MRRPVGLRRTIVAAFAFGALVLSAAMAIGTYWTARNYLIQQRERAATRQAFADASYVRDGLLTSGAQVSDILGAVSTPSGAVLVRRGGQWYSSSLDVGEPNIPDSLRSVVEDGHVGYAWHRTPSGSAITVGVPLPSIDALFFEQTSTSELTGTLNTLRVVLSVFAALTALAGAGLGLWAARRVVSPLDRVAGAAAQIAAGALDTRLPPTHDPDLAPFVASFNSMVDAVDERIEHDARFAADVSHELRSPLTSLITSVEVLGRRRGELSERSQQALDLVTRDLARFQRVLEDLLDLSRLEAGAAQLVLVRVDACQLLRYALEASGHRPDLLCVASEPGCPPLLRADKEAMHRAFLNLVENADRHGGGLTGLRLSTSPLMVSIYVEDAGPGVPEPDRERIFERFFRGGARGSLPGAGLGLSLVAETVHAHGGTVHCTSGPDGHGSRFVVVLPRQQGEQETS